jgi:hypothetical protein
MVNPHDPKSRINPKARRPGDSGQVRAGQPLRATLAAPARAEEERSGFSALWLLLLLPIIPAMLLVLGLAIYFLTPSEKEEAPPPQVKVVVQQQSAKKPVNNKPAPPKYTVKVEDSPPEFTRTNVTPAAVEVQITDEAEERPHAPKEQPVKVEISGEDTNVAPAQPAGEVPVDKKARLAAAWGPNCEFGLTSVDTGKLLTFAANGGTNETLLRVNGQVVALGGPAGKFIERNTPLPADPAGTSFGGAKTAWATGKLVITVMLDLVPSKQPVMVDGQQKRLLDTLLVRYVIENKDTKAQTVGLRMQLDTLIGGNDGVPFTVPGLPGLVTTFADFPKQGPIPDFLQALEVPNLQNPGTVAHLSLKPGKGVEVPSRVSLTHWQPTQTFEVPLTPLTGDSAVIMYWKDVSLKAGGKRVVGFAYGLGSVASTEPGGKLGLTLGGNFTPGETFTATAYVQNPAKGQKLTLELPQGLERVDGKETENVPAAAAGSNNTSIVTWKVKVLQTGTFPLKVVSSTGQTQGRTITIARGEAEAEARLSVHLSGSYEPGQDFNVEAKLVSGPNVPELTLKLPKGLEQTAGPAVEKQPPAGKESVTVVRWKVKVVETGKHAVRVEAANGLAVTKTLAIVRPQALTGGDVAVALDGPFAPGKAFTLRATVSQPLPGQTLTFHLPPGLHFVDGPETAPMPRRKDPVALVAWKVQVDKPGTFPLRVQSSNGIILKKTITITQTEEKKETGGNFELSFAGDIEPGKEFKLLAKVQQPVTGQKLALTLPKELQLMEGPAERSVPAAGKGTATVTWRVRVLDKGTLPIRVESSTGMVRTMTITLTAAPSSSDGGKQIFGGGN